MGLLFWRGGRRVRSGDIRRGDPLSEKERPAGGRRGGRGDAGGDGRFRKGGGLGGDDISREAVRGAFARLEALAAGEGASGEVVFLGIEEGEEDQR